MNRSTATFAQASSVTTAAVRVQGKGIFHSVSASSAERNGQSFDLLGPVDSTTNADQEVRPAYRVRFADGMTTEALADEVNTALTVHQNHDLHVNAKGVQCCKNCGGAGSSLPRECPGYKMNDWQTTDVGLGKLTFADGQWTEVANTAYAYMLLHNELEVGNCGLQRAQQIRKVFKASKYTFDTRLGAVAKSGSNQPA